MRKLIAIIITILIFTTNCYTQNLKGRVFTTKGKSIEYLNGVSIKWIGTDIGTLTDSLGKFSLETKGIIDRRIIAEYIGYRTDTTIVEPNIKFIEIELKPLFSTDEITVVDEVKSNFIDNSLIKREVIGQKEFKIAPCCDLSGVFGKNVSVDVVVTDILTNTKELKLLGLEGSYTQILIDNLPIATGINTKYNVTSIPGTLIEHITISKGANSVVQGTESISGITNVILKDYEKSEKMLLNLYLSHMLESQINMNYAFSFSNWKSLFAFQGLKNFLKVDENNDSFLDAPLVTRFMGYNKWKRTTSKSDILIAGKYLFEERTGGQKNFDPDLDKGSNLIYGQTITVHSADIYSRQQYNFKGDDNLKVYMNIGYTDQESFYGITKYNAKQLNSDINTVYEITSILGNNKLKVGFAFRFRNLEENISFLNITTKTYAGKYLTNEAIPGIYSEGLFNVSDKLSILAGLRLDRYDQDNYILTPRTLIKYSPNDKTTIRVSVGTGFRTPVPFVEYSNLLASSKNILFPSDIKMEKMLNYGVDILRYFDFNFISGNVSLDFYRTIFSNKVMPDFDRDYYTVYFRNFDNAHSNVFQIETNVTLLKGLEIKSSYKFTDLQYTFEDVDYIQPFAPKHRILFALTYTTKNKGWVFNSNLQWFGRQRIPSTSQLPPYLQISDKSEPYTLIGFQVTKFFEHFEIYAGVENFLNFIQNNSVIDNEHPFGPYFNTSYIWGPTKGREFFAGLRYIIK